MARKGKIVRTAARETGRARGWLQSSDFTQRERKIVRKDLHLVLAAREQKAVVLSADNEVLSLLTRVPDLNALGWASISRDDVERWLADGASASEVGLRTRS